MLRVEGLEIRCGRVEAVRGIDLEIGLGEVVALLGPNGAGKTSTLRGISQLVDYEGTVRFSDGDLRGRSPQAVARDGLIHVPEGRRVFANLSVHENLQVGLTARGSRDGYTIDEVYDLFPQLKLVRNRPGWALSGGEQQMVAIGRGLLGAPRLLMLDEPSLGLAPRVAYAVFDALSRIRERTSILLVEQNTLLALELCTRGYVIVGGRIVLEGSSAELSNRGVMLEAYLGKRTAAETAS